MPCVQVDVVVVNEHGLHARPAMMLVELASQFASEIRIIKGEPEPAVVDGKSIMQVMTLAATRGTELRLEAEGEDADQALVRLRELFRAGFEEE
jgi:phosphocarrier protein